MSRSLRIEIAESAEELREMMNHQARAKFRERLQILYWIKIEFFRSLQELADHLGRSKSVIVKWLKTYRTQGLAALLEWNYHGGRRSKLSDAILDNLQQRLSDPTAGFNSYKEVKHGLCEEQGLEMPYSTVHRIVHYKLRAKRKVARPTGIHRDDPAVVEFKKNCQIAQNSLLYFKTSEEVRPCRYAIGARMKVV
jgi:transposase